MTNIGVFIAQQNNLKNLKVCGSELLEPLNFFNHKRIVKESFKFQLQSFACEHLQIPPFGFIEFVNSQQGIKEFELLKFCWTKSLQPCITIEEQYKTFITFVRSLFTLPCLQALTFDDQSISTVHLEEVSDVINVSVNNLTYKNSYGALTLSENLFNIFPSLQTAKIEFVNCKMPKLKLVYIPSEKLSILNVLSVEVLSYEPPLPVVDQNLLEKHLIEFTKRHKNIKKLTIGSDSWIERNLRFSLEFWKIICSQLINLEVLVIYNPSDIEKIAETLSKSQQKLRSVSFQTNATEKKKIKGNLPDWMRVNVGWKFS